MIFFLYFYQTDNQYYTVTIHSHQSVFPVKIEETNV